ncbi:MAG: CDP-alcohol phosphatidyltransferase family protein [Alphaproteobacteria bacterium]|nr:CDP-alcohol phosphatidyltransferase family protein [Alphaproteobacteria bacterium]
MRRVIDPPLNSAGAWLAARGVAANGLTVTGFVIGMGAVPALAVDAPLAALVLILLNRLADGLDGAVARVRGPTDFGGYLDIVLDFLFYSAVVFGVALGQPEHAVWAAFLIFSFVGTGVSFLAFAIVAAKRDLTTDTLGKKSIYYLGGLAEGTETIVTFVLICLFPDAFPWIAGIFGAMCWITTVFRINEARRAFGG